MAQAEGTLALYNWGDYINPEVLTRFTAETGIAVTLDTYSSNEEMLAKIQAGATGYDIVFPSVHMNDIMIKLGLLEKTGINESPDFKNIDPAFLRAKEDPASEYCLPYAWGTVGIFYNEDITGPITGWADFFALPEKTGAKITLLDDMREVLAIGHIMNGTSVNSTDPAEVQAAADYILAHKGAVSAFTYEVPPMLTSGDIAAGHFFVGGNAEHQIHHPGGRRHDVSGEYLRPGFCPEQGKREEVHGVLPEARDRRAERQPAVQRHAEHARKRADARLHQVEPEHQRGRGHDDPAADLPGHRRGAEALRPGLEHDPHGAVNDGASGDQGGAARVRHARRRAARRAGRG
jgi:hypothetical protein